MKSFIKLLNFSVLIIFLALSAQVNAQHRQNRAGRKVSQPAAKVRFVSGESSLGVPFYLSNNLILMQASVNNSKPMWFILDTGASITVIDTKAAKALHLMPSGKEVENGAAGRAEALIFKGTTLRFPNVEAVSLTVYGLPLDFMSYSFGRKIGGVIGNDIIKEFVVEIDYQSQIINFYEPRGYQYSGGGEIIPVTLELEGYPFMRLSVEPEGRTTALDGKFELDTGSTEAFLFNMPFVNKHQLLKSLSKAKQIRTGGVGGSGRAFIGRVKSVGLGRFAFKNSVARFFQDTGGDNASAKYDGLIGGEIFRRFKVIFDYSRRRMILEPNANLSEPFEEDMSGLDVAAEGDDFSTVFVNGVEAKSPAAEAGIQEEDVIKAIDARPVKEFTLDQIRRLFMQEGREYLLTIKRGEQNLEVKIKLKRQI